MHNRRFISVAFALLLAVPFSVFAGEFDFILGDIERFEQEMKWQIQAEVRALDDHEFQEGNELFLPAGDVVEDTAPGIDDAVKFVRVKIDGIPVTFSDVPTGAWFAPYVKSSANSGIVSGYRDTAGRILGTFGPADDVTIEQMAKMALQAAGVIIQDCAEAPQNNTATGSWSAHYIACAEHLKWAVFSDASVDVKRAATRSEVVVTLLQAFNVSFTRGGGELFTDVTSSIEFSGAIEKAANDGIVSGYADADGKATGEFGPANSVNRAEVAKMMTLALDTYGK